MSARKVATVKAEKVDKVEVIETSEKVDKTAKAEKVLKADKAAKTEKATKVEKAAEKSEVSEEITEKVIKKKPTKKEESAVESADETTAASATEVAADTEQAEETIDRQIIRLMSVVANTQKQVNILFQDLKKLHKNYIAESKKNQKIISKTTATKKQRSGSSGLDKLLPIQTAEFRSFVEKNYQQLNDKDGNTILTELAINETDGSLLLSRKTALKLITAYVKHHNLQQYDDKKRIKMDKTLQKLFPDNAERKEKDGSVIEENFYFYSIMKALSRHFNKEEVDA